MAKGIKQLRRDRARWEFNIRVYQLMDNYKSKEEPTVKLTKQEMLGSLADIVASGIHSLSKSIKKK